MVFKTISIPACDSYWNIQDCHLIVFAMADPSEVILLISLTYCPPSNLRKLLAQEVMGLGTWTHSPKCWKCTSKSIAWEQLGLIYLT